MKHIEVKNTLSKLKNSMGQFNSRLDTDEKQINELKDHSGGIIQKLAERDAKRWKRRTQSQQALSEV